MKKFILLVVGLSILAGCANFRKSGSGKLKVKEEIFRDLDACFLAYDLNADKIVAERGGANCTERAPATSTFKIPLALIAFDSKHLSDENSSFKWDGTNRSIATWNQDQTAATWMKDSVVWVSQALTTDIGSEKLTEYLKMFNYGNQNMSGGLTSAWLTNKAKGPGAATLLISPREQLEFMKGFWKQSFKLSPEAYKKTKTITQLESLPHGFFLSGKTGSGFIGDRGRTRLGWFLGHIEGHGFQLLTVLKFQDNDAQSLKRPAGEQAKEMTLRILRSNGLQ